MRIECRAFYEESQCQCDNRLFLTQLCQSFHEDVKFFDLKLSNHVRDACLQLQRRNRHPLEKENNGVESGGEGGEENK